MNDWCDKLKTALEKTFSMPFDISQSIVDGEEHFMCIPKNESNSFFSVQVYIHNQIRLLVHVEPQKYGRDMLNEMELADESKKACFFDYIAMLQDYGAKVEFKVNDTILDENTKWPDSWRTFSCRIIRVPVEINSSHDAYDFISEWMLHGVGLVLSLLTISDVEEAETLEAVEGEGEKSIIKSTRYERNPINRKICLHKKGYSCAVCGANLFEIYGEIGRDYIEIHHITPVSMMGEGYILDIDRDLEPLCPNCHAMIHRKNPPYTIEELRNMVRMKSPAIPFNIPVTYSYDEKEGNDVPMAAEDYERYLWHREDCDLIELFGNEKTILFGCYKNKNHLKWIQENNIYNIRLGARKGSMSGEAELFEQTAHLVLYDVNHPNELLAYEISSCCEMSGQQLLAFNYPSHHPGKAYMTFKLTESSLDIQRLKFLRLINRIEEEHPEHIKGMPVFLEP